MRRVRFLMFVVLAGGLGGCSHSVHLNHTSDFVVNKSLAEHTAVEARKEQRSLMGMVMQTDYVDAAYTELQTQCPEGRVTGIQTRYSTSHGFFFWTNVIYMKGYCTRAG